MGVLHQHTVKVQMNYLHSVFHLMRYEIRQHIGLTAVLTILQFNITKPTKPFSLFLFSAFFFSEPLS